MPLTFSSRARSKAYFPVWEGEYFASLAASSSLHQKRMYILSCTSFFLFLVDFGWCLFAFVGMGFCVHFELPHAGGDDVAFFVAGVADGLGDIAAGGEGAGEASSDDVGGVHEEDEGVRVDVFYEVADAGDLGEVDDGEDNFLVSAGESALAVEEGRAVVDGAQDGIRDFKRLVGDDEGCFSLGKTKDETAGEVRIDVHADQGADGWFQSEDPCTGHDDDEVQCEDDVADFQVVVLLDDGTDDVEAAGVAVVTVKDTHGDAQDDTAGDGSDDRVLDDVVVSQEGREVDEKGKENGPEDRDDGVKFPHEFQGKTEDWEVQDKVRDADRNAGQVVYNHGDTCQPASQELVRDEEGIDADGINESA